MGGTVVENNGKSASNILEGAVRVFDINTDSGEVFSEPFLVGGLSKLSLQSNTALTATTIAFEGANFSSDNTLGQKDGYFVPHPGDFDTIADSTDTALVIPSSTGLRTWDIDLGGVLWARLLLSAAQTATFNAVLKG